MRMRSTAVLITFAGIFAVWVLCLIPMPASETTFQYTDKVEHLVAYLLQSICLLVLFPKARWKIVIALLIQAALIEGLQSLTVYRSAEWADMLANTIGVLLGLSLSLTALGSGLAKKLC